MGESWREKFEEAGVRTPGLVPVSEQANLYEVLDQLEVIQRWTHTTLWNYQVGGAKNAWPFDTMPMKTTTVSDNSYIEDMRWVVTTDGHYHRVPAGYGVRYMGEVMHETAGTVVSTMLNEGLADPAAVLQLCIYWDGERLLPRSMALVSRPPEGWGW